MEQNVVREEKIRAILEQEIRDGEDLARQAARMIEFLLLEKKGYAPADLQKNATFEVKLGAETTFSSVDFLVSLDGEKAMIIKCAAGSLDSRERQAVASARVIAAPPVPIAVVADPVTAEVLDATTGRVIGEGFGAIPLKDQLRSVLAERKSRSLSPERIEKEKRILLAFDAIRCCVPRGGDGGVEIGDACNKKNE